MSDSNKLNSVQDYILTVERLLLIEKENALRAKAFLEVALLEVKINTCVGIRVGMPEQFKEII